MSIQTEFTGGPVYNVNLSSMVVWTALGQGLPGKRGPTPYEEWLERGNTGSYEDFLLAIGGNSAASISADEDNRLIRGSDGGLKVEDDFGVDLLAHYILTARG